MQYSQAVRAGNYVYTSGSVGMTKEGQMVQGTVRTGRVIPTLLLLTLFRFSRPGPGQDSAGHPGGFRSTLLTIIDHL
jgi:hypothetical protein